MFRALSGNAGQGSFYDYVLFVSVPLRHRQSSALRGQAARLDAPEDQPLDSAKGQRPLDPVSDAAAHPAGSRFGPFDKRMVFDGDLAAGEVRRVAGRLREKAYCREGWIKKGPAPWFDRGRASFIGIEDRLIYW